MNFATMDLSERARRLRRLSWLVSTAARTVALLSALLFALVIAVPDWRPPAPDGLPLTGSQTLATALAGALPLAAALWALWLVGQLFSGFAAGNVFTVRAGDRLRWIGVALMVGAALSLTTPPLLELAFAAMGRGSSVAVTITPQQITGLVAGVACLALGHVMAEAADMRAELDEFV